MNKRQVYNQQEINWL